MSERKYASNGTGSYNYITDCGKVGHNEMITIWGMCKNCGATSLIETNINTWRDEYEKVNTERNMLIQEVEYLREALSRIVQGTIAGDIRQIAVEALRRRRDDT